MANKSKRQAKLRAQAAQAAAHERNRQAAGETFGAASAGGVADAKQSKRKKIRASELAARRAQVREVSVLVNEAGDFVYYNGLRRKTFVMNEGQYRMFRNFSVRFVLGLTVGIVIWGLSQNMVASVAVALAIWVVSELWFHLLFLNKLPSCANDPEQLARVGVFSRFAFEPTDRVISRVALAALIALLVLVNLTQNNFTGSELFINYVLAAGLGAYACYQLVGLAISRLSR